MDLSAGAQSDSDDHGPIRSVSGLFTARTELQACLQLCLALRRYGAGEYGDELLSLLELIACKRVGNRSGRMEPRALKRRSKPYPMLMQARRSARAEVRRNGHPKTVK